jgi:hypothetical protein
MKKIILKCFLIICCTLLLTSLVSASSTPYTQFTNLEYTDFSHSDSIGISFHGVEDEEEIQYLIKENNIYISNTSDIDRVVMCVIKERETNINQTERPYLKNITEHGKGYFKDDVIEQIAFSCAATNSKITLDGTMDPYLWNSHVPGFIITRDIISDANKSLKISEKYEYDSDWDGKNRRISAGGLSAGGFSWEMPDIYIDWEMEEHNVSEDGTYTPSNKYVSWTVWNMYSYVTFETYNIFKNEWETGELYIPEGTVCIAVEYENNWTDETQEIYPPPLSEKSWISNLFNSNRFEFDEI